MYSDENSPAGHRAIVTWDSPDASSNEEVPAEPSGSPGSGTVTATHRYASEGTKMVLLTIIDPDDQFGVAMCGPVKVLSCVELVCELIESLREVCTLNARVGARLRCILVSAKDELERARGESFRHRARDRIIEFLRELKAVMRGQFHASGVSTGDVVKGTFGVYEPACVPSTCLTETSEARRAHARPLCAQRPCNSLVSPKDANELIAAALRIRRCLDYSIEYYTPPPCANDER